MADGKLLNLEIGRPDRALGSNAVDPHASVTWQQWAQFPVLGLLVVFSVPSMTFSLYKPALQNVLGLTSEQAGDIASFGSLGSMVLGFVPGLIFDKFGYVATVIYGGITATIGALTWYLLLKGDGEKDSPSWVGLALSFMLMCHGCRAQYFAGMCAVLGSFPSRLVGSMSAAMACLVSVGYPLLPLLWSSFFLPAVGDAEAFGPDGKTLKTLIPVAHFFLMLTIIYMSITIMGLSAASFVSLKRKGATTGPVSLSERCGAISRAAPRVLLIYVVTSHSFVQTFMVNGVGSVAQNAGLAPAEQGGIIFNMGLVGTASRFLHGFGADMMRTRTRAGQAGTYLCYISAVFCTLLGFLTLAFCTSEPDPRTAKDRLFEQFSFAVYFIGFGFGGLVALLPASVRTVFGAEDMGFWLGALFAIIGVLFSVQSRLGAAFAWGAPYFFLSSIGSLMAIIAFVWMSVHSWGSA